VSLDRAVVVGTGLIGTSVALALTTSGVTTYLTDSDPAVARQAADLGAGIALGPDEQVEPVDLAVLAVPPAYVARVLADQQRRGTARAFTDVASVKARPQRELEALGCDPGSFVGGHPLAGRERSGPGAARADLFEGRPWVLTPSRQTSGATLERARELATLCGAVPVLMGADEHDHAVALVSHAPHLVSSLMAARLVQADEDAVGLAGQGVRDVTRIAAGDSRLWTDILSANAAAVADVLEALAGDLTAAVAGLRAIADSAPADRPADRASNPAADRAAGAAEVTAPLVEVLERGNAGHARIPGKHGAPPARYAVVPVVIPDRPGALAALFAQAGEADVNIEDVAIEHSPGQPVGLVELSVQPPAADRLVSELRRRGWTVHR
jgi:prephenate dehydrogenase